MGRDAFKDKVKLELVQIKQNGNGKEEVRKEEYKEVEFFTWEKLDHVDKVKSAFGL
jgi:S-adenosylmethionine synthetase